LSIGQTKLEIMINDRYMELVKPEYKVSYLAYLKDAKKMDAFSTHQPLLIHMLNTISEGDVLEFGMGWHSTPLMHLLCGIQGRALLSVDTDKKWFDKFLGYISPWHDLLLAEQKEIYDGTHSMFKKHYVVAFVDAAPAEIRQPVIERVKDMADYVIVHDSECVFQGRINVYKYDFSMYKHVMHFKPMNPATSVLSNLDVIDPEIVRIFE
jgi:hypothetical protein